MLSRQLLISLLVLACLPATAKSQPDDFIGAYKGELILNETSSLPLQLNLKLNENDELTATLDSPAQGSFGIPIDQVTIDNSELSFSSRIIQASFSGQTTDTECYQGEFTQGQKFPLTLCPTDSAEESEQKTVSQQLDEHMAEVAIIDWVDNEWQVHKQSYNIDGGKQFEIGSVSKTMVALLLAKAIQQDRISAESTVGDVWPEANKAVAEIRLIDLATHHSGLPRLPDNLLNQNQTLDNINDPYASYGLERLQEALKQTKTAADVTYQYSNFGYGLLAETIAKAQQTTFKDLINSALFEPMNMRNSGLALRPRQHSNLIAGHRIDGQAVPHWHFGALAGAGAVISTVDDMVSYVKTLMQPEKNWQPVVNQLLTPQHALSANTAQGLAWILEQQDEATLIWHNGQTAGFSSFVGFTADRKRGVVILSNQARTVTNIGKQLLVYSVR